MKISVDHLQEKALTIQIDESADAFPVLSGMQADGSCVFSGPVKGQISAVREYDHVRVAGAVAVPVTLTCSRCLALYEKQIGANFTIFFRKGAPGLERDEDEVELNEQDLVSATYSGDEIDLTHEIEEQVAMEVPFKPLCSEACKGLCPTCGKDLNQGDCSCGRDEVNFKFSALKDFKVSR
ncbi:DUF177 domain-containing protein [Geobacter sp. AOG2]|uniref:YceD family protein n=1 Tax=Geobacter sp. AOG2 TaxID=1566347 RepID=UPI001CC4D1DB|nr:DUF177 domain-containing protein [Geobacter sp. AOG2]GFE61218.1 hypothetical protein AOG2_18050 [Geobacter sp. AOG2]